MERVRARKLAPTGAFSYSDIGGLESRLAQYRFLRQAPARVSFFIRTEKEKEMSEQKVEEQVESHEEAKPETDWKAESRKWEARAKENKSAAEKLAELQEAEKTELEKALARAEEAESKLTTYEQEKQHAGLIKKVMTEQKVDAKYASLLTATDEDGLMDQAKLLAERFAEAVPSDTGKQPETKSSDMAKVAHDLFGGK